MLIGHDIGLQAPISLNEEKGHRKDHFTRRVGLVTAEMGLFGGVTILRLLSPSFEILPGGKIVTEMWG